MAKVQFSQEGGVGEIVLTDPPLNLFDMELARDLVSLFEKVIELRIAGGDGGGVAADFLRDPALSRLQLVADRC